jgi:hypothetical protein
MKTFLFAIALVSSFAASAQVNVYPQVINFGNSVQVQIHNTTKDNISCSGNITMHTQLGRMENAYYFDQIYKGSFSTRMFYPMTMQMNDRITFANHSIFCRKAP